MKQHNNITPKSVKPRIKKSTSGETWVCSDSVTFGIGLSPKAAYAVWKNLSLNGMFGMFKKHGTSPIDGMEYQNKLREEWD